MVGLSDEQLAEQIRADRIDVLFDLAGHTAGNRLLVFARKPAPIQITWAGYVGTTGLAAMDYILADRYDDPAAVRGVLLRAGAADAGRLRLLRPAGRCAAGLAPAGDGTRVRHLRRFHNPPKITPEVVEVWARILHRVPRSRLVLKYRGMDDPSVAGRLADAFAGRGVDPARLEFRGCRGPRQIARGTTSGSTWPWTRFPTTAA